jgi:hypothetical protein
MKMTLMKVINKCLFALMPVEDIGDEASKTIHGVWPRNGDRRF